MSDTTTDLAAELAQTQDALALARREIESWRSADTPNEFQQTVITKAMQEDYSRKRSEEARQAITARREREERAAKEREAARRQRAADELEAFKDAQLTRFIALGGKGVDWPGMWKTLEQDYLRKRMEHDPVQTAVAELRADPRYQF